MFLLNYDEGTIEFTDEQSLQYKMFLLNLIV